jgi:hypothetical protein
MGKLDRPTKKQTNKEQQTKKEPNEQASKLTQK